jgi:hypothetical protein
MLMLVCLYYLPREPRVNEVVCYFQLGHYDYNKPRLYTYEQAF